MEAMSMLKRVSRKWLWPLVFYASCEKKTAQSGSGDTLAIDKTPELEAPVPVVEGPYLNERNVVVKDPVPGIIPVNPYKDVVQNHIDLDDLASVVTIYNWDIGFENSVIDFKPNGDYSLGHEMHDGFFAYGNYEVNGNSVLVRYPYETHDGGNETDFYGPRVLDWLFDGKEDSVLVYDKAYKSYSVVTCLRYGDKIFKNYALRSPYGQEYEIDGLTVIKCDDSESMVEIKENLKMRRRPDINADAVTLTVYRSYYNNEMQLESREITGNIVKEGEIYNYTQKTVKHDTIDGITAPWYRINVIIDDIDSANVWVFGGYLREFTPEEVTEWRRERGWI
jgi:hypothetical protein